MQTSISGINRGDLGDHNDTKFTYVASNPFSNSHILSQAFPALWRVVYFEENLVIFG